MTNLDEIMGAPISPEEEKKILSKIVRTTTPWTAKDIRTEVVRMRFEKLNNEIEAEKAAKEAAEIERERIENQFNILDFLYFWKKK